jgi:hypothetical protein
MVFNGQAGGAWGEATAHEGRQADTSEWREPGHGRSPDIDSGGAGIYPAGRIMARLDTKEFVDTHRAAEGLKLGKLASP